MSSGHCINFEDEIGIGIGSGRSTIDFGDILGAMGSK